MFVITADIIDLQIEEVCQQLKAISELADGFDAVGISQGGQFLRAYVERYNDPPVRNLITIGAQHQGVMALPGCPADNEDCGWWNKLMKLGVFNPLIHHKVVQAQYYKNPNELDKYMAINDFLADINNEKETKNPRYKENLSSLHKFVMYMFEEDKMVVPKESSVQTYVELYCFFESILVVWLLQWNACAAVDRSENLSRRPYWTESTA